MFSENLVTKAEASSDVAIPLATPEPRQLTPGAEAWTCDIGASNWSEAELLARQAARESMARTYPRGLPIAIGRAQGAEVFSVDGRRYLDFFAGAGVLALGHNHPRVVEAVEARPQIGARPRLPHSSARRSHHRASANPAARLGG